MSRAMRPSPDTRDDDLPPALSSLWRTLKLGYRAEPFLLVVSFGRTLRALELDPGVTTDGAWLLQGGGLQVFEIRQ